MLGEALAAFASSACGPARPSKSWWSITPRPDETPQVVAALAPAAPVPLAPCAKRSAAWPRRGIAASPSRSPLDRLLRRRSIGRRRLAAKAVGHGGQKSRPCCVGGAVARSAGPDGQEINLPAVCRKLSGEIIGGPAGRYGLRSSPGYRQLSCSIAACPNAWGSSTKRCIAAKTPTCSCASPTARGSNVGTRPRRDRPSHSGGAFPSGGLSGDRARRGGKRRAARRGPGWLRLVAVVLADSRGRERPLTTSPPGLGALRGDDQALLAARCRLALAAGYTRAFCVLFFPRGRKVAAGGTVACEAKPPAA